MEPRIVSSPEHFLEKFKQGKKKQNYLEWDEYFMGMAFLELRKHPERKSVAIILNKRKIIISVASSCPEANQNTFVEHAEYKALAKSEGGTVVYTTMFPCEDCAKALAKAGILEIIYYYDDNCDKSKKLLEQSGVTFRQFSSEKTIEIDFSQYCDNEL